MKENKITITLSAIALILSCISYMNTLPNKEVENGKSAYEIAVDNGFEGSELEWLESLAGKDGNSGLSAYEIAVNNGFEGSEQEWLMSLIAKADDNKSAYESAVEQGYDKTVEDFTSELFGSSDAGLTSISLSLGGNKLFAFMNTYADTIQSIKLNNASSLKKLDELYDAFYGVFNVETNFVNVTKTLSNPTWNYTTSTFSGWGGSIGAPEKVDTIKFKVRAREKVITEIKVFISENDKNGEVLFEETLHVNIESEQASDVYWTLPEVFENTEGKSLYFTYNCNQFCDLYTNTGANIKQEHYQAVATYATNGKHLSSPSKMQDVAGKPCRYIYVELGTLEYNLVLDEDSNNLDYVQTYEDKINVFLPEQYELVVGDTFQLFYRGVIQAVNPYNYHIQVTSKNGSAYPRYYEWTPTEEQVGEYSLEIQVYDNNHNLLGKDKTKLIVKSAQEPKETINVLCFGDSLTAGGYWVKESYRRLTQSDGTPVGSGLANINYVGSKSFTVNGQTMGFEGTGGWQWSTYLDKKSPFYDSELGEVNFTTYCERNNIEDIDLVYILLTWNGQSSLAQFNMNSTHFVNAQILIDKIHEAYPNALVRCMGIQMPSQNGGMGTNYGANGGYSNAYGMLVTAMNYNKTLEQMTQLDKYKDFVKYVDTAGQFDTDYNMPNKQKPVNTRNPLTETFGTNGVHPSTMGYYQIADAAYRSIIHDINNYYQTEEVVQETN